MKKILFACLLFLWPLLSLAALCFGHACDDPWRPNPNQEVKSGSIPGGPGAPDIPSIPPPPPPAPGEPNGPAGGPAGQNAPGAMEANVALENRLQGSGQNQSEEVSPDNIVLIPETSQLKIIGRKGDFRTYVVNKSPRDLFDIKLQAISPAFDTEVDPESIKRLVAGEKDYYTVRLKLKDNWKGGKFPLDFKVTSRGAIIYEGGLDNTGASSGQAQTPAKPTENLGLRLSRVPTSIVKNGSFKVFAKNNVFNELNNIQLLVESKQLEAKVQPLSVKKLSPGAEAEFTVKVDVKKGTVPGVCVLTLNAKTSSRNVFASQHLSLEVKSK